MEIDLNVIIDAAVAGYRHASTKATEWYGRGVTVLKSGMEFAMPYLQDKRIAVVSLVAVNLILIEIGSLVGLALDRLLPIESERQQSVSSAVKFFAGLSILGAGVYMFAKHTKLPLDLRAIALITTLTVLVRARFT